MCWDFCWIKIMGFMMMMRPVNWATNQRAPAVQMCAGQSGLWNYRVNQLSHTGLLMMFTFLQKVLHVSGVWPSSWLITLHSLKGWVGVFGTNLDWHSWLDFFQLIDWMRHVCRFSSWSDAAFLYIGYSKSILFVRRSQLHSLFLPGQLDSHNEIIVPQMKLFCCGFLFTIALTICWCLIFLCWV